MDEADLTELAIRALIACVSVTWLAIVWHADRNPALKNFTIVGFVMTRDGFPDRVAFGEITVLAAMTTWGSVMVLRNQISEWFITAYLLAFVLRGAHAAYLNAAHPAAAAPAPAPAELPAQPQPSLPQERKP